MTQGFKSSPPWLTAGRTVTPAETRHRGCRVPATADSGAHRSRPLKRQRYLWSRFTGGLIAGHASSVLHYLPIRDRHGQACPGHPRKCILEGRVDGRVAAYGRPCHDAATGRGWVSWPNRPDSLSLRGHLFAGAPPPEQNSTSGQSPLKLLRSGLVVDGPTTGSTTPPAETWVLCCRCAEPSSRLGSRAIGHHEPGALPRGTRRSIEDPV